MDPEGTARGEGWVGKGVRDAKDVEGGEWWGVAPSLTH